MRDYLINASVRLSANYADIPFDVGAREAQAQCVTERVSMALGRTGDAYAYLLPAGLDENRRNCLLEKRLLHEDTALSPYSVAYLRMDEKACIQTALADHVSISVFSEKGDALACCKSARKIRGLIAQEHSLAYDADFGYLTAQPCAAGTGMRATLLLNLPAVYHKHAMLELIRREELKKVIIHATAGDLLLGRCGVYYIENRISIGMHTEDIIQNLLQSAEVLLERERQLRTEENDIALSDAAWRAYGIATCARSVTQRETLKMWSELTMGVSIGAYALDDKVLTGMWNAACGTITHSDMQADANIARADYIRSLF